MKKVLLSFVFISIALGGYINYHYLNSSTSRSIITLENVEALADGETDPYSYGPFVPCSCLCLNKTPCYDGDC